MPPQPPVQLVFLDQSSWSERARFALQIASIKLEVSRGEAVKYTPFVDELWLRYKMGKWSGKVSVPVLFVSGKPIAGSRDIALWASQQSSGKLQMGDEDLLNKVENASDLVMLATRYRGCIRIAEAGVYDAQDLPPGAGWLPASVARFATRRVFRKIADKYKRPGETMESDKEDMRKGLSILTNLLKAAGGKRFSGLEGGISFVDIVAATSIQFVPLPGGRVPYGPNVAPLWREPDLEAEFSDLIAWRDSIYNEFRLPVEEHL